MNRSSRMEPHRYKISALEDRVGALEDWSPQTRSEPVPDIGLEPLRLVPQNWQGWSLGCPSRCLENTGWSLGNWRSVSSSRVGALHILYLIYWKEEIKKSIYSYCSFCVLNISDLTGKNNNWKEILIHPPLSISNSLLITSYVFFIKQLYKCSKCKDHKETRDTRN